MLAESFRKKMREHAWRKGFEEGLREGREEALIKVLALLVKNAAITPEQRDRLEAYWRER